MSNSIVSGCNVAELVNEFLKPRKETDEKRQPESESVCIRVHPWLNSPRMSKGILLVNL